MVVTAHGEVQTSEEAQVYVHDRGLFVTEQFLEDTPAVLSLGKLCEEHGCAKRSWAPKKWRICETTMVVTAHGEVRDDGSWRSANK